ncbi:hypothetical protein [Alishewanella sp. HL-SH06]|uniref:hypothetical protein n=1 Tax=Alishewanella sp. HL-SH06 TaxID=3461144 RepID=UPI0040420970
MRSWIVTLGLLLSVSAGQLAAAPAFQQIPLPDDAQEMARLETKMPAVLHYFSQQTQQDLLLFYITALGEPNQQKTLATQKQLYFFREQQQIRVVIAERNGWREVSVMVQGR